MYTYAVYMYACIQASDPMSFYNGSLVTSLVSVHACVQTIDTCYYIIPYNSCCM